MGVQGGDGGYFGARRHEGTKGRLRLVYERLVYEELDSVYLLTFVTWKSQSEALPGLVQVVEVRTYKGHMVYTAIRRWVKLPSYPGAQLTLAKTVVFCVAAFWQRLAIEASVVRS
ncbi:hypothetical protein [Sphingorhabdus sp.]|uniref:hypothetical protein n=1 Tax=Sphingorhabdus sp. TaxID=1902408 RepID=UPI000BDBAE29|nr:hypothetical protein [Sphingorhabdus sp.]OYZ60838.1 MAG: hypothetical protein B7Y10_06205 [Sphingomonadales bacterium 24-56-14]